MRINLPLIQLSHIYIDGLTKLVLTVSGYYYQSAAAAAAEALLMVVIGLTRPIH